MNHVAYLCCVLILHLRHALLYEYDMHYPTAIRHRADPLFYRLSDIQHLAERNAHFRQELSFVLYRITSSGINQLLTILNPALFHDGL